MILECTRAVLMPKSAWLIQYMIHVLNYESMSTWTLAHFYKNFLLLYEDCRHCYCPVSTPVEQAQ